MISKNYSSFITRVDNRNYMRISVPNINNTFTKNYSLPIEALDTKNDFYFDSPDKYGIVPNEVVRNNVQWATHKTKKNDYQYFLLIKRKVVDKYLTSKYSKAA